MEKVDLSKLKIEMLDGSIIEHDFARELAQTIFQNTQDIAEHSFSVDLYKNPEIELTEENMAIVNKYAKSHFKAFVQVSVNKLLNNN